MDKNKYVMLRCAKCGAEFKTTLRNRLGLCPTHVLRRWYDHRNLLQRVRRRLAERGTAPVALHNPDNPLAGDYPKIGCSDIPDISHITDVPHNTLPEEHEGEKR